VRREAATTVPATAEFALEADLTEVLFQ